MQEHLDLSRAALEESLALAEQLGEPGVTGMVLQFLGGLEVTTGHLPTARRYYERATALNRLFPERRHVFIAGLTQLGRLALIEGDIPSAIEYADEVLALARTVTEAYTTARALSLRGWIAAHQRDDGMARRYFAEALTVAREGRLPQLVGNLLVQEAWLDLRAGSMRDAHNRLIEALLLWHRMGAPEALVHMLRGLAGVSANIDPHRAARLAGAATGVEHRLQAAASNTPSAIEPLLVERWVAAAHRSLGDAAFRRTWADGESLTDDQAVQYGLETPVPDSAVASHSHARSAGTTPLTSREEQIARLICGGMDNGRIAQELVISRATAERHVSNILHKLGFSSRAEVAAWAATHL
jgi:DNA-binding CsgD family transcriptional regulator